MSRVIDFYNGHDKVSHSHGTTEHVVMVLFVAWQAIQEKGSRWARGASLGALVEELRRWRRCIGEADDVGMPRFVFATLPRVWRS
jgi:hypothetical protein